MIIILVIIYVCKVVWHWHKLIALSASFLLYCIGYFQSVLQESVYIEQQPEGKHFTGQSLTLTCWTHINDSVDTPVVTTHEWIGPGGNLRSDSRKTVTGVMRSRGMYYYSQLIFNSLLTSDSGSYRCQSTLHSSSDYSFNSYIVSSDSDIVTATVNAGISISMSDQLILH